MPIKAGLYAAGYDLQMNMLGVPLAVMQLAGYPLAISALTERGCRQRDNNCACWARS